jgi:hypothetical protein
MASEESMKMHHFFHFLPQAGPKVLSNIQKHEKSLPEATSGVIYDLLGHNGIRGCASQFIGTIGLTPGFAQ